MSELKKLERALVEAHSFNADGAAVVDIAVALRALGIEVTP